MDDMDRTDELNQPLIEAELKGLHAKVVADNVPFIEGECDLCGEDSKRLVRCKHPKDGPLWSCARCRDKYKISVMGA